MQTTVVVIAVGEGNVWIDGAESCPGDEGLRVPASPEEQRAWAELLMKPGAVRITVEPVPPPPDPLTGGDADINVRVRVRLDCGLPHLAGRTGTLMRYSPDGLAEVRFDDLHVLATTPRSIERAPAECPHCGASQVTR